MVILAHFYFSPFQSLLFIVPNLKALKKVLLGDNPRVSLSLGSYYFSNDLSLSFLLLFVPRMTSNEREVRFGELLSRNRFLSSTIKIREESLSRIELKIYE